MGPASGPEAELVGVSVSRPRAVLEVDVARCRAEAAHLKSGISLDARSELGKVGTNQAQCSYYYRHGGVTGMFQNPPQTPATLRLDGPGENRDGRQVRALVTDTQFLCSDEVAAFNVKPRTHHGRRASSFLWIDGHVSHPLNRNERYTVDLRSNADLYDAFNRILRVFEFGDADE